jgi:hypothetical protein
VFYRTPIKGRFVDVWPSWKTTLQQALSAGRVFFPNLDEHRVNKTLLGFNNRGTKLSQANAKILLSNAALVLPSRSLEIDLSPTHASILA